MQVVRPSVCDVEVSWSYRSSKIIIWLINLMCLLCRPQQHGSTPKGTPQNFGRNRVYRTWYPPAGARLYGRHTPWLAD